MLLQLIPLWPSTPLTPRVVLVAHYDSRDIAERDPDANRTGDPIPGANDGASGVAVLLELGRLIPMMNLTYEVELLFTDAEGPIAFKRKSTVVWSRSLGR